MITFPDYRKYWFKDWKIYLSLLRIYKNINAFWLNVIYMVTICGLTEKAPLFLTLFNSDCIGVQIESCDAKLSARVLTILINVITSLNVLLHALHASKYRFSRL